MFRVPRTHEEWLEASAVKRLGSDPVFATCRERNPLVARFWLGFCRYYDSGFEAVERGDMQASDQCRANIKELVSWCSDGEPRPDDSPVETIERKGVVCPVFYCALADVGFAVVCFGSRSTLSIFSSPADAQT